MSNKKTNLLTITQSAKMLEMSRQAIYYRIKQGLFPEPVATYGFNEVPLYKREEINDLKETLDGRV